MAVTEKKPIKITETILRDAHQSLIATRMTTEQMLPIVDKMDKVGYHSVECWGGATFDASLRFLKEDPWERLRKFRDGFKNTKLQMLFRGQNILGYRPYADDVVEYFVQKSVANGIDIIRIFDCLNDLRNLQTAVMAANREKDGRGKGQSKMSLFCFCFCFCLFFFKTGFFCVALAVLELCRPGWPQTQKSAYLCLRVLGLKACATMAS